MIIDGDEPEKIRILRDEMASLEAHLKDIENKKSTLEWELAINRQNSQKLEDVSIQKLRDGSCWRAYCLAFAEFT